MAGLKDPERVHFAMPAHGSWSEREIAQQGGNGEEKCPTAATVECVFIGRKRELRLLKACLRKAARGSGSVVLIEGEPGIGKTRLADKVAECARAEGMKVVSGRCREVEGAPAFWPWIQLLRVLPASHRATEVAELLPVVQQLGEFAGEVGLRAKPLNPEQARFCLFDSVTLLLKKMAHGQGLVLILEDIHWADRASLQLLEYVGGEVADARLVVVATYRDAELPRQAVLQRTLAELARVSPCERLVLQGFTSEEIAQFVAESTNVWPADAVVAALHAETEGTPFFVAEVVRCLVVSGELNPGLKALPHPLPLPAAVRDVIRRRLDTLSAECHLVLTTAAVVGREFTLPVLVRVNANLSMRVLRLIDEAITARVVARVPQGVGSYRFVHPLIRETIYGSLSEEDRARLHCAVGGALAAEGITPQGSLTRSALLAHHYFRALPYGGAEKAIFWAVSAAMDATEVRAHEDAVRHYQKAVTALVLTDEDGSRRCDLLLSLGEAQNRAGEISEARKSFRAAARLARQLGLTEQFARAALGFGGLFAPTGAADRELIELLEDAILMFGGRPSPCHARALAGLSIAIHFHETDERRLHLAERAVEMARTLRDRSAELFGLEALRYALLGPSGLLRRVEIAREMVSLADRYGDGEAASRVRQALAADLLEHGDAGGFVEAIDHLESLAAKLHQPRYQVQSLLARAMRALIFGRFEEADKLAVEGFQLAERIGDESAKLSFWTQKIWSQRDRGGSHELDVILRQGCIEFPAVTSWRAALVLVLSEARRVKEATDLLSSFVIRRALNIPEDAFFLPSACLLAAAAGLLEDVGRCDTLYRALFPYRERFVAVGLAGAWLGPVTHYLGILAARMRRWKVATAHFNDALQKCEAIGARPLAARTRYELGKVLAARGERQGARERLNEAAAEFEQLGMTICLEIANEELRAFGSTLLGRDAPACLPAAEGDAGILEAVQSVAIPTGSCIFRREGEYWTVAYGGKASRLRHRRGFEIIARLLGQPHRTVRSIDLAVLGVSDRYECEEAGLLEAGLRVGDAPYGDLGEALLDERTCLQYRARLRELCVELDEAERLNDRGRAEKIRTEVEFLEQELSKSLRPSGRGRGLPSAAERARISVRNSVSNAIRVIGEHNESLERHLANSIKTGMLCSYAPERVPSWQL